MLLKYQDDIAKIEGATAQTLIDETRAELRRAETRLKGGAPMNDASEPSAVGGGALAENIVHFARALREAGVPLGPGAVLDALAAVEAAGFSNRRDFHATLHAVFVKKHEHSLLFDQAFEIFWKRRGLLEKLIAMMSPQAPSQRPPQVGRSGREPRRRRALQVEAGRAEGRPVDRSRRAVHRVRPGNPARQGFRPDERGGNRGRAQAHPGDGDARRSPADSPVCRDRRRRIRIDPRRSFRRSLQPGGAIDLAYRAPMERAPPVVALCDISGSMSEYTRLFLHFLHALGETRRVSTFLFGTRLTNVTRAMRARDPDEALAQCCDAGGRLVGRHPYQRGRSSVSTATGRGACSVRAPIVLLFTDGLERDGAGDLGRAVERLRKSSRRVIWVNPLLRFDGFAARAQGVRAILPHVDAFRPIHNLASMADLCATLAAGRDSGKDPKTWLAASA